MSQALERVIAEQQATIDRQKAWEDRNLKTWKEWNEKRDALAAAAFLVLNNPEREGCRAALRDALVAWGFCIVCEQGPCECERQYD